MLGKVVAKIFVSQSFSPPKRHSRLGPVEQHEERRPEGEDGDVKPEELRKLGRVLGIESVPEKLEQGAESTVQRT